MSPEIRLPVNDEIIDSYVEIDAEKKWAELYDKLVIALSKSDYDCLNDIFTFQAMSVDTHKGYQFADNRIGPLLIFGLPEFAVDNLIDIYYTVVDELESV